MPSKFIPNYLLSCIVPESTLHGLHLRNHMLDTPVPHTLFITDLFHTLLFYIYNKLPNEFVKNTYTVQISQQ